MSAETDIRSRMVELCEQFPEPEPSEIPDAFVYKIKQEDVGRQAVTMGFAERSMRRIGQLEIELKVARRIAHARSSEANDANNIARDMVNFIADFRRELSEVFDHFKISCYTCPRCGNKWLVPAAFVGNPVWDCPECKRMDAADKRE